MDDRFDRIVAHPDVLSGKPCIRGTRISVEFLLELLASGATHEEILKAYSQLTEEDIAQALRYAKRFLENEIVLDVAVTSTSAK